MAVFNVYFTSSAVAQLFERADGKAAAVQTDELFGLELVERLGNLQAATAYLIGQLGHSDGHPLGPCGIQAVGLYEVYNALAHSGVGWPPSQGPLLLYVGRQQVDKVEPEDGKAVQQPVNLVLVNDNDRAGRVCLVRAAETGPQAEEAGGLEQLGRPHILDDRVVAVRGRGGDGELAVDEKVEGGTGTAVGGHDITGGVLVKSQAGVSHQLAEVALAHTLEEGKLLQLVVDVQGSHGDVSVIG